MNANRRKELATAYALIDEAYSRLCRASEIITEVMEEEQDAFDNMPESLQESERGEKMTEAIDELDNALSLDWDDLLCEMMEHIETAKE